METTSKSNNSIFWSLIGIIIAILVFYYFRQQYPKKQTQPIQQKPTQSSIGNIADVIRVKVERQLSKGVVYTDRVFILDGGITLKGLTKLTRENNININALTHDEKPQMEMINIVDKPDLFVEKMKENNYKIIEEKEAIILSGIYPFAGGYNKILEVVPDDPERFMQDELGNLILIFNDTTKNPDRIKRYKEFYGI